MSLPEEPFAVKQNRLLCVKCGTTSKTIDYIDTLRACAMRWKADGAALRPLAEQRNAISELIMDDMTAFLECVFSAHDAHSFWSAIDAEIEKARGG